MTEKTAADVPAIVLAEIEDHGWWKGNADSPENGTCLVVAATGLVHDTLRYEAIGMMAEVAKELYPKQIPSVTASVSALIEFNDHPKTTKAHIRKVAKEAGKRLRGNA